jgi:CheY-like chemotaxis protein
MSTARKILVIDDDDDFKTSVRSVLEDAGYSVLDANSGEEGLRMLVEHSPDIVVLDIMMDTLENGYGVNQAIKFQDEYEQYRRTPIIMVSSIEQSPDERFPRAGEVDMVRPDWYLSKPVDVVVFLKTVEKAAKRVQAREGGDVSDTLVSGDN